MKAMIGAWGAQGGALPVFTVGITLSHHLNIITSDPLSKFHRIDRSTPVSDTI